MPVFNFRSSGPTGPALLEGPAVQTLRCYSRIWRVEDRHGHHKFECHQRLDKLAPIPLYRIEEVKQASLHRRVKPERVGGYYCTHPERPNYASNFDSIVQGEEYDRPTLASLWGTLLAEFALLLAATVLVASPQHEESVNAVLKERLSAVVGAESKSEFTGVVFAEFRGQVVANFAVGRRGDAGDNPNTTESLFEIASATKPLTAIALMALAEQGKLSLDDPIHKHLPKVPEDCNAITIRPLLQRTSGIPGSNVGPPTKDLA